MKNLPNLITLIRILLIPLFIILLLYGYNSYALLVFIVAGLSDALDGFIARTWNLKTRLGAFLDPVADKLLLLSAFITLVLLNKIPLWIMIIIIGRDIILGITGLILLNFVEIHSYRIRPSILGKITTVLQILTILLVLVEEKGALFSMILWATVFATVASGLHYVYRESRIFRASKMS